MNIETIRRRYLSGLPSWEADQLLQLGAKKDKTFILTNPKYRLKFYELVLFFILLFRFRRGIPLAYLAGQKEFFGLDFIVNKHTLIPRPDTELMVEEAIKIIASKKEITLIDIGTGSGCIPIAILKNVKPAPVKTFAIDISEGALKTAKKNADKHGTNIIFKKGDLLIPVLSELSGEVIITANLPYLTKEQFDTEPSIQKEPRSALVTDEGGLALYKKLLVQMKNIKQPVTALFEIDPGQTDKIKELIVNTISSAQVKIKTDLAGRDRLVIINFN